MRGPAQPPLRGTNTPLALPGAPVCVLTPRSLGPSPHAPVHVRLKTLFCSNEGNFKETLSRSPGRSYFPLSYTFPLTLWFKHVFVTPRRVSILRPDGLGNERVSPRPEDPQPPCMCVRRAHPRAPGCLGHRRLRPVVRRPEARGQGACRAGFSRGPSPRCDPRPSPAPPGLPVSACMPSALLARMLGPPSGTSCDLDDVFKDPKDGGILWAWG